MADPKYNGPGSNGILRKILTMWLLKQFDARQRIILAGTEPAQYPGKYYASEDPEQTVHLRKGSSPPPLITKGIRIVPTNWVLITKDSPYKGFHHWIRIVAIILFVIFTIGFLFTIAFRLALTISLW